MKIMVKLEGKITGTENENNVPIPSFTVCKACNWRDSAMLFSFIDFCRRVESSLFLNSFFSPLD